MLKIIAADDEALALRSIERAVKGTGLEVEMKTFSDPRAALEYARTNPIDVALLDIQMFGITGVELADQMLVLQPDMNIIFTTAYSEYMGDAFHMHASGYLLKPITAAKLKRELEHLRNKPGAAPQVGEMGEETEGEEAEEVTPKVPEEALPEPPAPAFPEKTADETAEETGKEEKHVEKTGLRLTCFGSFSAYAFGRPLRFRREKTRELLAFLTDRYGASCSMEEIMACLWEGDEHKSYLRDLKADLMRALRDVGCEAAIGSGRNTMWVIPEAVDCDYFDFRAGINTAAFHGEYMTQYSWGEYTAANLVSGKFE